MGTDGLEEESAEALAEGRFRDEFLEEPGEFVSEKDEIVREGVEEFHELRYGDLELSTLELDELEPLYTVGRSDGRELDPQNFRDRSIDDFLEFWKEEVGQHSNVDLGYAEDVLRMNRSGEESGLRERFDLQPHSEEVLSESESRNPVYDAVIEEMVQTLYGQALNKPEGFKREVEAFERVLKKFEGRPYRKIMRNNHTYSIEHLTGKDEIAEAADASGSCISSRDRYFAEYAEDPESMISAVRKDGETLGYMRNFLMEDENGDEFLAMDTIEIDHKNFNQNRDAVRAAGLGATQLMYDLEADYLVGADARVKYGVRQAYSNTEKAVTGEKKGSWDVRSYTFRPSGNNGKSAYLLMENPG